MARLENSGIIDERQSADAKPRNFEPRRTLTIGAEKARISIAQKLEASPKTYLGLFTILYFLAEFCSNRNRLFWVDEIFTYNLANLPSISKIWPLIRQGIELNPPFPFWLTWVVHHTLGRGEFLTRLPSIVGFWGMCVCLFFYVRRRSDPLFGFVALLLPLFTYTAWDATWARGYGLLLGFSAAALLCWQLAADNIRRPLTLPALTLSLASAISCHYYAAYVIAALILGEGVRTWKRKRPDLSIWIAIFSGFTPLLVYLPLLRAVKAGSKHFWVQPAVPFLYQSYADLFGPAAMVILLFLAVTLCIPENRDRRDWSSTSLELHELTACLFLAAMPLAVFVGAVFTPLAFYTRYVQPVVIGFTVITAMFLHRIGGANQRFRKVMVAVLVWFCFTPWLGWHMLLGITVKKPWDAVRAKFDLPAAVPSTPLIINQENDFLIAYHYAPKEYSAQLFYIYDPAFSVQYLGSDTMQRSMHIGQTVHDFHVVAYKDFLSQHRQFLVERSDPGGWVIQKLLADGVDMKLIRMQKPFGVFGQDHLFFEANVRAQNLRVVDPSNCTARVTTH